VKQLLSSIGLAALLFTACSSGGESTAEDSQSFDASSSTPDIGSSSKSAVDGGASDDPESTSSSTSTVPVDVKPTRVFVATNGRDNQTGETGAQAVATLQRALDLVEPGGTVVFQPGIYEPLEVVGIKGTEDAPVRLEAEGTVEFSDGDYRSGAGILIRESEHIEIVGMRVRTSLWGIYIDNAHHISVSASDVADVGQEGIRVKGGSTNIHLESNTIADTGRRTDNGRANGEGIYIGTGSPGGVDDVRNVSIINNRILRTTDEAIDVKRPSSNIEIIGNTISDVVTNTSGAIVVHLNGDQGGDPGIIIEQNVIRNVTKSSPHRDGNCIVSQVTVRIVNNVLDGCQHRGIFLRGNAGTATVLHNTLIDAGSIGSVVSEGRGMDIVRQNNLGVGGDANRVVSNEVFVDASRGNYRLQEDALDELSTAPSVGVTEDLINAPRSTTGSVTFGALEA